MRRPSSTWLSSLALLVVAPLLAGAAERPTPCLPGVFDGGQRLHDRLAPAVFWLELLLRQHELCWRRRQPEVRVVLAGNSAVHGFPLPGEQSVAARLNAHLDATDLPAHVFNLGFVSTYQLKDAVIINESLRYEPDIIIYPTTLAEFIHLAPMPSFGIVDEFFRANDAAMQALAQQHPGGLTVPLQAYETMLSEPRIRYAGGFRLRQVGEYARAAIRAQARAVRRHFFPAYETPSAPTSGRQSSYACADTERELRDSFAGWQDWNILAYLQQVHAATGIDVVIVNWPVAHEPVGDCYNVRYTTRILQEYNDWLAAQARQRGMTYVDLHDVLPADDFLDSLHVSAEGQRAIADRLAPQLDAVIERVRARRR